MAYFVVMLLAYQYLIILLFYIAVLKLYVLFEAMNQKNEVQDVMMMLTYSSPLAPFYTKNKRLHFIHILGIGIGTTTKQIPILMMR